MRRRLLLGTAALLAAATTLPVQAQDWPGNKPIRIIVPYSPGGSSDIIARAISNQLGEALKTSVVVENKPGANGNTGTDFVAKAPADGLTLLLCDVGALAERKFGLAHRQTGRRIHAGHPHQAADGQAPGRGGNPSRLAASH